MLENKCLQLSSKIFSFFSTEKSVCSRKIIQAQKYLSPSLVGVAPGGNSLQGSRFFALTMLQITANRDNYGIIFHKTYVVTSH